MKICYIIDGLRLGGKEKQFFYLVSGLIQKKYIGKENLLIISMNNEGYLNDLFDNIGIEIVFLQRKYRYDIFILFRLFILFGKFRPHIIHSFSVMTSLYISLLRVFKKFIFLDGSIRNANLIIPFKKKLFNAVNFLFSDKIIANSKAGLSAYGVKKRGKVIYNGIDIAKVKVPFNNASVKKTHNIITKYVIGMVATFSEKKDYKTFFRAAEILLKDRQDITFISVGGGPIYLQMKNQYAKNNSILFLGKKDDIFSIVSIFDIGVLSTNDKIQSEGISNAIMEYMYMGKPVIATDGGGTNEILVDGETGFLINPQSPEALAERIDTLLNNRKMAQRMGKMGKERIIDKFSLSKMIDNYWTCYRKLLEIQLN